MTADRIDEAVRRAASAGAAVVGRGRTSGRGRTDKDVAALVEKFGRHPDGYLHARVVIDGKAFYFHQKYGSWLAPGMAKRRAVLKEPEALLGSTLGTEIKYELSRLSAPFDLAARREREAREEHEKRAKQPASKPEDGRSDDEPVRSDRVSGGGDQDDAPPEVQPQ